MESDVVHIPWVWRRWREAHDHSVRAERELERSRELLRDTERRIDPLRNIHERNQFADIIRDGLLAGHPHSRREAGASDRERHGRGK